jgi:anti-sigma factor RsiW
MAEKITNCAQARESMADAVSGVLWSGRFADFEMHLRDCATCHEEFRRMQTLLQAIDQGVSASVAAEPSPRLLANVRQAIAERPYRAPMWLARSAWLTTVSVCALAAICLFAARTFRNAREIAPRFTASSVSTSPTQNHAAVAPNCVPTVELANSAPPRKLALATHHSSPRNLRHPAPEQRVIVEPGQMQAILQLVAATQRRQVNGSNLFVNEGKADEPLEIKPLVIAPLKISALEDEAKPPASNGGLDSNKSSLDSRSN